MEVGKLSPYDLLKDFQHFYTEVSGGIGRLFRVLHNGDQIVRCSRDYSLGVVYPTAVIKYWNMDGTPAAQFTMISGSDYLTQVIDIAWSAYDDSFYVISSISGTINYVIQRFNSVGAFQSNVIEIFSPGERQGWSSSVSRAYTQIATGEDYFFIKVDGAIYRYPYSTSLDYDDGSLADGYVPYPGAFYPTHGLDCYNFSYQPAPTWNVPSGTVPSGYLLYTWFDSGIQTLYVRSIMASGTMAYMTDRWTLLDITNYNYYRYPLFVNKTDPCALHYISCTATGTLAAGNCMDNGVFMFKVFNIDDTLAAFININVSDIVMPAGSGETALITAHVINCWGTDLEGKQVTYWVSSGDGQVIALEEITDAHGISTAIFTAGPNIGMSQVTAVVNEI